MKRLPDSLPSARQMATALGALWPRRGLNGPLAAGALLVALAWGGWHAVGHAQDGKPADKTADKATGKPAEKAALSVQAVGLTATTMPTVLAASGNVAAWHEASVGAEVGGLRVAEVRAEVGDVVRKGDVLARLADDTVRTELAQADASLAEAQAALAEAQANAQRARSLDGTGALSAQAMSQYQSAEATATARVAAAQAALAAQKLRLAHTEIKAPDGGTVSARLATVGSVAGAGQEMFRLIRASRLEWRADVPAAELARLRPGVKATVTTPSGQTVAGTVRLVAPTVDPATRNGLVYVDLAGGVPTAGAQAGAQAGVKGDVKPDTKPDVKAGMFVRGEFALASRTAQTLPTSAVLLREGFDVVMRLDEPASSGNGLVRVAQTKVRVIGRQGDRVAIEGLPPEARVVLRGAAFLTDGDTVKLVADAPKTTK